MFQDPLSTLTSTQPDQERDQEDQTEKYKDKDDQEQVAIKTYPSEESKQSLSVEMSQDPLSILTSSQPDQLRDQEDKTEVCDQEDQHKGIRDDQEDTLIEFGLDDSWDNWAYSTMAQNDLISSMRGKEDNFCTNNTSG